MAFSTQKDRSRNLGVWDTVRTVLYAVLIALTLRTLAFEPFNIPSGSMKPTLEIGDYLFVSKYSYGYTHYSLPLSVHLFSGRLFYSPPERGDVVVFKEPRDNRTDYIKRVIGLPGDRIQVRNGLIYINGEPVKREQIADYSLYRTLARRGGRPSYVKQYIETLPNGRQYRVIEERDCPPDGPFCGPHDNTPELDVPLGHFLMMGDNRDNSSDGRDWGFVPAENLIGKAATLFVSFNCEAASCHAQLWEFWKWPEAIRWKRLFRSVN